MAIDAATIDFSQAQFYRKTSALSKAMVRVATAEEEVVTKYKDDEKPETKNVANPGDYIITDSSGGEYVIRAEKFDKLYEQDPNDAGRFVSKSVRKAVQLSDEGRLWKESWGHSGEMQKVEAGGYATQSISDPTDIHLVKQEEFEKNYTKITPEEAASSLFEGKLPRHASAGSRVQR
jgi:hypothetical protein